MAWWRSLPLLSVCNVTYSPDSTLERTVNHRASTIYLREHRAAGETSRVCIRLWIFKTSDVVWLPWMMNGEWWWKMYLGSHCASADETFMIPVGRAVHVTVHCEIGLYNRVLNRRSRRGVSEDLPLLACDNKYHTGQTCKPAAAF